MMAPRCLLLLVLVEPADAVLVMEGAGEGDMAGEGEATGEGDDEVVGVAGLEDAAAISAPWDEGKRNGWSRRK